MDAPARSLPPIVLAREPAFQLGPLEVRPETCELVGEGRSLVVEPRVMQVLVALHQAGGHVVSRDDLLQRCWAGRVVGDDAIHRVLSRLRRDAELAGGHFRVETITKVGYRLIEEGRDPAAGLAPGAAWKTAAGKTIDRRALIAGGGAIALAGAGFAIDRWRDPPLPAEARRKLDEGERLWRLGTLDGQAAAHSAFRAAAAIAPDHAEPWGRLALSHAYQARAGHPEQAAEAERSARASMARALSLDPNQPHAIAGGIALDYNRPQANLASIERRLLDGLRAFPNSHTFLSLESSFLSEVGRLREALAYLDRWREIEKDLPPRAAGARGYLLFHVGRTDEADQTMAALLERWPRHTSVWFSAIKLLMFSARYDRALAMLDDLSRRPVGIPEWNFELTRLQTLALMDPARHGDRAGRETLDSARHGTGFAENAILFFSARGLVDEAVRVAQALYFGRGFKTGPRRFTREQGHHDNRRRRTSQLFERPTAPLRADPRFIQLTTQLGLEDYWRTTGTRPDYRS